MNIAVISGLFVVIAFKILHSTTNANDESFDSNAQTPRIRYNPRKRFFRRKINARRGYFRQTTETQFQSYDSWGAGGQLELMLQEYDEGLGREEYSEGTYREYLPPDVEEYQRILRAQVHQEDHNKDEREYQHSKLMMKGNRLAKVAKTEDFWEPYKFKGDWVFNRTVNIRPSEVVISSSTIKTTTRESYYLNDKSCYRPCPLIYRFDYGEICAIMWHRPKDDDTSEEVSTYPAYYIRNFTNLCHMEVTNCIMLHTDQKRIYCSNREKRHDILTIKKCISTWKVMFRGKCPPGMDEFDKMVKFKGPPGNPEPLTNGDDEIKLAKKWIEDVELNRVKYAKERKKHAESLAVAEFKSTASLPG